MGHLSRYTMIKTTRYHRTLRYQRPASPYPVFVLVTLRRFPSTLPSLTVMRLELGMVNDTWPVVVRSAPSRRAPLAHQLGTVHDAKPSHFTQHTPHTPHAFRCLFYTVYTIHATAFTRVSPLAVTAPELSTENCSAVCA